ncbi:hypothetical protein [Shewanella sp. 10N.286.48.A6]|uniref:hypothetical protein n=1 Tax=Shewanella sp. 10N.286.48.A6 TaxID=1880833 RepID=UPI000C820204|nr:hypothetical protein [Shewanella sp. 10N.286.48.A6]PMH97125.1 hypothetical protein BCU55_18375 [Shewanella sp. 10N.286.48.A6]
MKLVLSIEFINDLYSSGFTIHADGAEHYAVIDYLDNYKILKYDIGSYFINMLDGSPVIFFGVDRYNYEKSYLLGSNNNLIEAPEFLPRSSEGYTNVFFQGYRVFKDRKNRQCIVYNMNSSEEEVKKLPYRIPTLVNRKLYFDNFSSITEVDSQLNERWKLECDDSQSTGFGRSRFFADNLLIYVSFFEEPSSLSPWPGDTVNAVCLDTGKTLWSTTFDDPVMSVMHHSASSQSEAAIYIGTDKHCIVLNAETGKQRLKFASPYNVMDMKPIFLDDGSYQGELRSESRVWTDGHFIYFTGNSGGWSHYGADQLHLYRMDGSYFSGPIQIPPAYRFDAVKQCFHLNGKSYIPVSSASQAFNLVDFGVIIIDPLTLTPESDIELEKGPVREIVHRVHDKKTESYQLQIIADESADNARDDLIRFSEIEIKRIAARFGDQRWTNEEKNRKFNGEIELVITGSDKMKQECHAMLDILVERVHLWAEESEIDAGNRKEPIKVSWQWIEG